MPVIACKLGFTQQTVGGATYSFNFCEKYGAHVAHVHNLTHAACFLSVEHYREIKPLEQEAAAPMRQERQRKRQIKPVVNDNQEAEE